MNAPTGIQAGFILAGLILGTLIAVLMGLYLWRSSRAGRRSMRSVHVISPGTVTSGGVHESSPAMGLERGVWRPPPRQQLLDRQATLWLAGADGEMGSGVWPPGGANNSDSAGQPQTTQARLAANRKPASGERASQGLANAVRGTGIGRKRLGLETLITEVPASSRKSGHESKTG